jgi:hypothetical protein
MASSGSFAVSIKLIDMATSPINSVNKAITGLEKTVKHAAREGGLLEVRDAMVKVKREAGDLFDKLGSVFTPLGGLTAAGSIAGMASLAQHFANTGAEIGRTSKLYNVATDALQNWRGGVRLAGGTAEGATSAIAGVGKALWEARAGINPDVFRVAQEFKLDIHKPDVDFLLDAADKLQDMNAHQRLKFASFFNIDNETLLLLSRGRAAVKAYLDEAARHGKLTREQIEAAEGLHHAYRGLELSVESMGLAIGGQIGTWMTPMLTKWTEWLDKARETPATMKAVEIGVDALAGAIGITAVAAIGKLTWKLLAFNAVWLTSPIGRAIAILGALDAAGALTLPIPHQGQTKEDEGLLNAPGPNAGSWGDKWQKSKGVWDFLFGGSASRAPGAGTNLSTHPGGGAITAAEAMAAGLSPAEAAGAAIVSKYESPKGDVPNYRYDAGHTAGGYFQITDTNWRNLAPKLGIDLAKYPHALGSPKELQLKAYQALYQAGALHGNPLGDWDTAHGGAISDARKAEASRYAATLAGAATAAPAAEFPATNIDAVLAREAAANAAARKAQGLPPMGGPSASENDAGIPGYKGKLPPLNVPTLGPKETPVGAGTDAGGGDTSHRVEVHFMDAPAGLRTGLTRAEGPAETSIRVQYAMPHI